MGLAFFMFKVPSIPGRSTPNAEVGVIGSRTATETKASILKSHPQIRRSAVQAMPGTSLSEANISRYKPELCFAVDRVTFLWSR